jgi:hypothetical protein
VTRARPREVGIATLTQRSRQFDKCRATAPIRAAGESFEAQNWSIKLSLGCRKLTAAKDGPDRLWYREYQL